MLWQRKLESVATDCSKELNLGDSAAIAAEIYYENELQALFAPACYNDLGIVGKLTKEWNILQINFASEHFDDYSFVVQTSALSSLNAAFNLVAVFEMMSWNKVALIWSVTAFKNKYVTKVRINNIRRIFTLKGITLLHDVSINLSNRTQSLEATLSGIKETSRIWIPIFGYTLKDYMEFLRAVKKINLDLTVYVIILLDFFVLKEFRLPWILPDQSTNKTIKSLYDKTLANYYYAKSDLSFIAENSTSDIDDLTVVLYAQVYESGWLFSTIIRDFFYDKQNHTKHNGETNSLAKSVKNKHFNGPFGPISLNEYAIRIIPFDVGYVEVSKDKPVKFAKLFLSNICDVPEGTMGNNRSCVKLLLFLSCQHSLREIRQLKGAIKNYHTKISEQFPADVPLCGFDGNLCDNTRKTGESAQMPWAIPYHAIRFADSEASSMISVHSFQIKMDRKLNFNDLLRNRRFATVELGTVIVEAYNLSERLLFGDSDMALLHQMKQLVHDNVNQFIGICFDKRTEFYTIWNHCFRGTLADMMFVNTASGPGKKIDGPAFDENFKRAFVRDIIRGLEFLHSSAIGYHGSLTPSQCLIDSRWILKLSGFGISKLLYKWKIRGLLSAKDRKPLILNSDLYYYAPELRDVLRDMMTRGNEFMSMKQGRAADMYAFGIILFEVVFRKKVVVFSDNHYGIEAEKEEDVGIFNEAIEALIPHYPSIPRNTEVHPDLLELMRKCWSDKPEGRPDATLARKITDATMKISGSLVDQMIKNLEQYTNNLENLVKERTHQLEKTQEHAERLLLELLPKSVADELKIGRRVDPKCYKSATVMYSDIVGFTSLCSESSPMEVVTLLSGIFKNFDMIISKHKCYKVETIGDAYMVTSGVPNASRYDHVRDIASVAILMRDFLSEYEIPHRPKQKLHCRWGFNTGPVFAGVVGLNAPRYCVFGQTVTLASKMENSGVADKIQITLKSYQLLTARYPEFRCSPRGGVRIDVCFYKLFIAYK
ncbi:unnamed protein product [Thelazia callipaeda]|uniref:guanylate cyclase n=1 Tax=Thelazia callipaeda TaxID=103827 RepID=A0A0N5CV20_THECL|nr:unnamed protein product [Thelazia callipaeda]